MKRMAELKRSIVSHRAVVAASALIVLAIPLLWWSEHLISSQPTWSPVVREFAAILATSGVFTVLYEVFIRRQQIEFVLENLDLRESLMRTGLDDISTDYLTYDYSRAILDSRDIDLFFIYAQSWLGRYSIEIGRFLEAPGRNLRVCVPALDNPFVPVLAKHFGESEDDLRRRIAQAIRMTVMPAVRGTLGTGSRVRVYLHQSRVAYSLYRFDGRILVSTYYASRAYRRAPTFQFREAPDSLYAEFATDFKCVLADESRLVFDSGDPKLDVTGLVAILGDYAPEVFRNMVDEKIARGSAGASRPSTTDPPLL